MSHRSTWLWPRLPRLWPPLPRLQPARYVRGSGRQALVITEPQQQHLEPERVPPPSHQFPYPAPEGYFWMPDRNRKRPPKLVSMERRREHPEYYYDRSFDNAEVAKGVYRPFPKRTFLHRIYAEERRVRRMLPVPMSLTGLGLPDGVPPKVWRSRLNRAIRETQKQQEVKSEQTAQNITPALKLLLEQYPDKIGSDYDQIKQLYLAHKQQQEQPAPAPGQEPSFPFEIGLRERVLKQISQSRQEALEYSRMQSTHLTDVEFDNYSKHHKLVDFISQRLRGLKSNQYEPEVEAWCEAIWRRNYGRPDPSVPPSTVPCYGCGAHLHCTDAAIPGYVPSEKFNQLSEEQLRTEQCQRCEFLEHYNVSLDVMVKADEYPAIISKIRDTNASVVLMVDLLDLPCSLWPNIVELFGPRRKIYVVGNKVDLLPKDSSGYLDRVELSLRKQLGIAGINPPHTNIRYLGLISAKTGFGVEQLITKLLSDWNGREDIYLLGCTNVGKSTLFNTLLQSDLCALRDRDLLQRATTSVWPGTTLNLLKFPVRQLEGWELEKRVRRLEWQERVRAREHIARRVMYQQTQQPRFAMLQDRIGMTFRTANPFAKDSGHPFALKSDQRPFDPDSKNFSRCHFLMDTPGTVYKDQILTLLTTEELLKTVPRQLIQPRCFSLLPMQTLFVGGVGRIDIVSARQNVLLTVFASQYMPVHVTYTSEARRFYEYYLGTEMLGVPFGGPERLAKWPTLYPNQFEVCGLDKRMAAADVVLSSAGWVSVTLGRDEEAIVRAYTPEGRGLFLRKPALLPFACNLKGRKVPNSPIYEPGPATVEEVGDDGYVKRLTEFYGYQ